MVRKRWARRLMLGAFAALAAVAASPGAAAAATPGFGIADTCTTPTTGTNTAPNQPCWVPGLYSGDYSGTADTDYYTQAGGHPFEGVTDFTVASTGTVPNGNVSKIRIDIPPGLIANPQAVPQCTQSSPANCPAGSQLGVIELGVSIAGVPETLGASVYNMVPPAGKVADFAFDVPVLGTRIDIIGGIRSGSQQFAGVSGLSADDGLYFTIAVPSLPAELVRATLIFWGVPGDSAHAPDAGWSCISASALTGCTPPASAAHHPSGTAFLTLPSGCLPAGQVSTVTLTDSSGAVAQATAGTPVAATGCSSAGFAPTLAVTPQTTEADSPTGVSVNLHVPQNQNGAQTATSTLDTAVVKLPPGMTLDPSAAHGLGACSAAQFGAGSDAAPACPAGSQVGTTTITTPLLPGPLTGAVYLGCNGASAQTPCAPASPGGGVSASLYVYATAPAQGIDQKLVGTVSTDPATGQLTTTFAKLPQVPFSDLVLNLNGGPAAPLATPLACGKATTTGSLTPYSGAAPARPSTSFTVGGSGAGGAACPRVTPFTPGFSVSAGGLQAGAFDAPLTFNITRADRQQTLSRVTVALPPGLLAMLASVPECGAAQAAAGACGAASRIGSTTVLAGAGSEPISQSGSVYLTGPYEGAPFGLSIVVPATAGPFNLGLVVVRARIDIDRTDAHATVTADPLPQVVGGVPLRIRGVSVTIDRSGFIFNPTNCAAAAITATFTSAAGAGATGTSPFTPTGCGALAFSPALRLAFSGRNQTRVGRHPAVTATLTAKPGQANLRSTSVTLPLSLALDPNNSTHVCTVTAAAADSCPARTAIGRATVQTPLLNTPLSGTVYLVQGLRKNKKGQVLRTLPALLIPLRGQVALDLRGQTSVNSHGQLVTTFPAVPDAPLSRFVLRINGGRHGVLVVTGHRGLCRARQRAAVAFRAQSGSSRKTKIRIGVPCGKRARRAG